MRAWKQSRSGKTYFLYDGSRPVAEYNSTGTLTATHTFGADGLVSRRSVTGTPATTFYTFDERGNVAQRLNITATVQNTDLYDSYGSRTGTVSQPDPWGYEAQAGYYTDVETGLLLLTHRFYDPNMGRFLTRDPMGYDGGINLYGYTRNDPVNESDPDGYGGSNDGELFKALTCIAAAVTLEEELKKGPRANLKKIAVCYAVLAACAKHYCDMIPVRKRKYPITYHGPFPLPLGPIWPPDVPPT